MSFILSSLRRMNKHKYSNAYRPQQELENLEARIVLSFADGNGAVVLNVTELNNGSALVITFDGPPDAEPSRRKAVQSPACCRQLFDRGSLGRTRRSSPRACPRFLISLATYNNNSDQVTLSLGSPLTCGAVSSRIHRRHREHGELLKPRLDRRQPEPDRRRLRRHGQRRLLRPVRLDGCRGAGLNSSPDSQGDAAARRRSAGPGQPATPGGNSTVTSTRETSRRKPTLRMVSSSSS